MTFTKEAEILMKDLEDARTRIRTNAQGVYNSSVHLDLIKICEDRKSRISQKRGDLQAFKNDLVKRCNLKVTIYSSQRIVSVYENINSIITDISQALKVLDGEKT